MRPNPSLKRSANGMARLAQTLGLTKRVCCAKSIKVASATQTAEGIVFVKASRARRWAASGLHFASRRTRTVCDFHSEPA